MLFLVSLLLIATTPFLGYQFAQQRQRNSELARVCSSQLRFRAGHTQTLVQFPQTVVLSLSPSEHHDTIKMKQLRYDEDGIACHVVDIHYTTLIVDMRKQQCPDAVRNSKTAHRICHRIETVTLHVYTGHGFPCLDISRDKVPLGMDRDHPRKKQQQDESHQFHFCKNRKKVTTEQILYAKLNTIPFFYRKEELLSQIIRIFVAEMTFSTTYLNETSSTNEWIKQHDDGSDLLVWTDYQTAGRGCGDNSWESERRKNLLFSFLLHPHELEASNQFILSMASALALKDALDEYADDIMVKWPNDIYWHDRKLAGTLIEMMLSGGNVRSCIIGTGLNVNQQVFHSDAPNPISLRQIVGREVDRETLLQRIANRLADYLEMVNKRQWAFIRMKYRDWLWRKDGREHLFRKPGGPPLPYLLKTVDDDGTLVLTNLNGKEVWDERFGFKEIQFVI